MRPQHQFAFRSAGTTLRSSVLAKRTPNASVMMVNSKMPSSNAFIPNVRRLNLAPRFTMLLQNVPALLQMFPTYLTSSAAEFIESETVHSQGIDLAMRPHRQCIRFIVDTRVLLLQPILVRHGAPLHIPIAPRLSRAPRVPRLRKVPRQQDSQRYTLSTALSTARTA
ncbi:MAG: hypothetical protein FRX48_07894 [Lasallia pustulata]|uniref:Uncharacterized protein n=1 Tax=Lasallia pustulata TaxID=136370 RepID=A0A5M8PHP3_9LECA|nr:MAG: hypothetical protein FRX48_07894 [Lasallia pustulata]